MGYRISTLISGGDEAGELSIRTLNHGWLSGGIFLPTRVKISASSCLGSMEKDSGSCSSYPASTRVEDTKTRLCSVTYLHPHHIKRTYSTRVQQSKKTTSVLLIEYSRGQPIENKTNRGYSGRCPVPPFLSPVHNPNPLTLTGTSTSTYCIVHNLRACANRYEMPRTIPHATNSYTFRNIVGRPNFLHAASSIGKYRKSPSLTRQDSPRQDMDVQMGYRSTQLSI